MWPNIYNYLPIKCRGWEHRLALLNKNMIDLSKFCDIMCFQEMEYRIYRDVWKKLMEDQGFESVYERKLSPGYWQHKDEMLDGVSIFYNDKKFKMLKCQHIKYTSVFDDEKLFDQTDDTKKRLVSRNNVALVMILQHLETNQIFFVANTHLYWSPRHEDVKLLQAYMLTQIIWKCAQEFYQCTEEELKTKLNGKDGINIILVGDLNASPESMVYRYLTKGSLEVSSEEEMSKYNYGPRVSSTIKDPLGKFVSPYRELYEKGEFTRTVYLPKFKKIIDYIFVSEHSKGLKATKVLSELKDEYGSKYVGFPNEDYASDHLPIIAQFEFTPSTE